MSQINPKVVAYCPIGKNLEMFRFSSEMAIKHAGTPFEFVPVTGWNTSKEVYEYIKEKGWRNLEVKGLNDNWLHNLYQCWNRGYDAFNELGADVVVPMGSDHAFYYDWLWNMIKFSKPNRIVNCKLIESGNLPSIHECYNFGYPGRGFSVDDFYNYCKKIWKDALVMDESFYGRRLDAMPFACPKDVWERFGPMIPINGLGITGDTDWFNRCKSGGVEICKSLGSISYHVGIGETGKIRR